MAFAREGCESIALGDINLPELKKTEAAIKKSYPSTAVYISQLDITDEAAVERFHGAIISQFGRLDFAVNSAGYGHPGTPIHLLHSKEWDHTYAVNQQGVCILNILYVLGFHGFVLCLSRPLTISLFFQVFLCEREQLRQMLKQNIPAALKSRGSIINVTSLCQTTPMNGFTAYSASKGSVLGLSKCDALDYGKDQIRVNCLAPGNTVTPMLYEAVGDEGLKALAAATPLVRNATPDDIANAIVWLSSPSASFVTGTTLTVDGGYNLCTGPP